MGSFMTQLWESVFIPGPTPTLLIAANASFGALQVVLFALFIATYSAHFIALSIICAGVWWGINWFAVELRKAKLAEEEAARIRKRRREEAGKTGADGTADEEDGDEETETETEKSVPELRVKGGPSKIRNVLASAGYDVHSLKTEGSETSGSQSLDTPESLLKRKSDGGSSADLSSVGTDSEWEKVSEHEK